MLTRAVLCLPPLRPPSSPFLPHHRLVTFVAYLSSISSGITTAVAIAIHNIPEVGARASCSLPCASSQDMQGTKEKHLGWDVPVQIGTHSTRTWALINCNCSITAP